MSLPELDNLVRIGKLKEEAPSQVEFDGLIRLGWIQQSGERLPNVTGGVTWQNMKDISKLMNN